MLASRYVDRLHARLLVRYGAQWLRLYEGLDEAMVKADWAQVLDGVSHDGIRYALDNLPADWPPNARQFRALCNGRPLPTMAALPAPVEPADPERVAAALSKVQGLPKKSPALGCYENIMRIVAERGGAMSSAQKHQIEAMRVAGLIEVPA